MTEVKTPYTTIRINKNIKNALDEITPKSSSYSETIAKLMVAASQKDLELTYVKSIESVGEYLTLDEFNVEMEKEFGKLE